MSHQNVLILDFGGQYNQLIARRVRDLGVYCEIIPFRTATVEKIRSYSPIGLIFTGGPNSVYAENAPKIDPAIFSMGIPLWMPADCAHPRRQGGNRSFPRVWKNSHPFRYHFPAVPVAAG